MLVRSEADNRVTVQQMLLLLLMLLMVVE